MSGRVARRACIGTSGWNYAGWSESFYGGRPQKDWLRFCAGKFTAIEVNATFYRLQSRETFRRWYADTPPRFRFAIKANRYLTHKASSLQQWRAIQRRISGHRVAWARRPTSGPTCCSDTPTSPS